MCGGSPGQNFFRILAKKHFEKFFWVIFGDFFEEKIEDFSYKKDEILLQKIFLLHIKNIFLKRKIFFNKNIYILEIIEFQNKKF